MFVDDQCLFSLDQPRAVPVDTHVWQIAARDYNYAFKLKGKKAVGSMTKDVYNGVSDFFQSLWGDYAGWAHSVGKHLWSLDEGLMKQVLFTADLRTFKDYTGMASC